MDIDGGGWTVIQRRIDGKTDFYKDWNGYKQGFGNSSNNFWLGLEGIHNLTKGVAVLRIDLTISGRKKYAKYRRCKVYDESNNYKLEVSGYSGNAGDSLNYDNGNDFSTKDRDNDQVPGTNCAARFYGAWWHDVCFYTNLNSLYSTNGRGDDTKMTWLYNFNGYGTVSFSEMKIRGKFILLY